MIFDEPLRGGVPPAWFWALPGIERIHTGECELQGGKLAGMAVHIAARVQAAATPGEVLVSRTVKDLAIGSGMRFEDRGEHTLRGIPGEWRVYSLVE